MRGCDRGLRPALGLKEEPTGLPGWGRFPSAAQLCSPASSCARRGPALFSRGPGRALETKAVGAPGQRKAGATPLARKKQTTHSALGLCGFFESLGATPQLARA